MSGIDNSYKMDGDVLLVISLFLSPLSLSSLAETAAERAREREIVAVLPPAPSPHQLPPFIKRETERERRERGEGGGRREGGCVQLHFAGMEISTKKKEGKKMS